MKVLMINGSPHAKGNTYIALHEMEEIFAQEGIETEMLHAGNKDIRGCISCNSCFSKGKCVFDDLVNEAAPKFEECDVTAYYVKTAFQPQFELEDAVVLPENWTVRLL